MEQKTRFIQFGLENVEVINVPITSIIRMNIDEITETNFLDSQKELVHRLCCKRIYIKISREANKFYINRCYDKMRIFARFKKWPDIVNITYLGKQNNDIKTIYAPWNYDCYETNSFQKVSEDERGNLIIEIKER